MEHLLRNLIYHKFYKRYGYVLKINHAYDIGAQPKKVHTRMEVMWKDDGSGISIPKHIDMDHNVESVDFKHHIRMANERANDGKKTQSVTLE